MAGKIPQSFIDDLLARTNIVDVIDGRVKLKKTGKNYSGLCPFHNEKSPSFSVSPDKQFYYCFGCGAGGNAIGFLMEYEHIDFPVAVEELAKTCGLDVPKDNSPGQKRNEQQYAAQFKMLDLASAFYQAQFRQHPERKTAQQYLHSRGLDPQIVKTYGIGYAPPGWDNLLKALGLSESDQQNLERSGMLIRNEDRNSLYDRFRERIMFPIRDARGRVIAFGGRVLDDAKPKYLNSPETDTFQKGRELYGLYEARQHSNRLERVVIVEGYMDVVSLAQFGIHYAVATLGTATSEYHLQRLYKLVPEVVFCFDGDEAGRNAAKRALQTTLSVIKDGQQAKFLFLPEGEDPDTLVRKQGQQAFEAALNSALPMSDFFFKSMSEDIDMTTLDGRALYSSKALPSLQSMQPSLLKQMMIERISEDTGLSLEQLNSNIQLHAATSPIAEPERPQQAAGPRPQRAAQQQPARSLKNAEITIVNSAIALILKDPSLLNQVEDIPSLADIPDEANIDILNALVRYWQQHPEGTLGQMLIAWQSAPQYADKLLMLSEISRVNPCPEDNYQQTFIDCWKTLAERQREVHFSELTRHKTALKSNLSEDIKDRARAYAQALAESHRQRQQKN